MSKSTTQKAYDFLRNQESLSNAEKNILSNYAAHRKNQREIGQGCSKHICEAIIDLAKKSGFDSATSNAAATLGKLGGSAKTETKASASRENGKKGGRPKAEKVKFRITSGEGEQGAVEIHYLTEQGAKRKLTKERCNGDRWAFAEIQIGDVWVPFDY